ncbi:universal stress protein [Halorientalis brevis]|uniref:Universal stress protein n=1 Tax=Halorientalis brevis TaxID=1126241 RepID=A0ABD6CF30_9EURY|nr:universal stress protein [Halorientalis brevis]
MNVLLGIDGSDVSFDALDDTIARTNETGDDLTVAIVDRDEVELDPDEIETRVRDELADADLDAPIERLSGHPGSELVELADGDGFDRLVIPGGKRSALGKIRLDEMIEFVLLNAETTVTLIR